MRQLLLTSLLLLFAPDFKAQPQGYTVENFFFDIMEVLMDTAVSKNGVTTRRSIYDHGMMEEKGHETVRYRFVNDSVFSRRREGTLRKTYFVLTDGWFDLYDIKKKKVLEEHLIAEERDSAGYRTGCQYDRKSGERRRCYYYKKDSLDRTIEAFNWNRMIRQEYLYKWEYKGDSIKIQKQYKVGKDSLMLVSQVETLSRHNGNTITEWTNYSFYHETPYEKVRTLSHISYTFYKRDDRNRLVSVTHEHYYENNKRSGERQVLEFFYGDADTGHR